MSDEFDEMLELDPLLLAEKLTGKSYKDDEATSNLGLALHIMKNKIMTEELELRDDTHYNSEFGTVLRIYLQEGFEIVHAHNFPSSHSEAETLYLLWHPEGILAKLTSYTPGYDDKPAKQNDSVIYGNWVANDQEQAWATGASGGLFRKDWDAPASEDDPKVWIGDWDVRTGLRNTLSNLRGKGHFLPVWVARPSLYLDDYSEASKAIHERTMGMPMEDFRLAHEAQQEAMLDYLPDHLRIMMAAVKRR